MANESKEKTVTISTFTTSYPGREITNTDYFFMLENQIRSKIPDYESGILLQEFIELLKDSNIKTQELKHYPVEGYYNKSEALKYYFNILRNLQLNQSLFDRVVKNDRYERLKALIENDIWGEEPKQIAEFLKKAPFQRRWDILTITMSDRNLFNPNHPRPWDIDKVMNGLIRHYRNRTNLVELAYLTGNPKCLCSRAETNILYRSPACITGSMNTQPPNYIWKVSPEVESLGKRIVNKYNEIFNCSIVSPSIFNHNSLNWECKYPRVSRLGEVMETGETYYWILDENNVLTDKYSREKITTESITKNTKRKGNTLTPFGGFVGDITFTTEYVGTYRE